jgi:hypothetical protein
VLDMTVALLPPVTCLGLILILLSRSSLTFGPLTSPETLNALGLIGVICLAGLATGYAMRHLLMPGMAVAAPAPLPEADGRYRDRLARYVVTGGTIGIGGTAICLIVALAARPGTQDWQERATAIFTTILPVFSTWVGTVLAFYFTNESYRQAAAANLGTVRVEEEEPLTRPGTMIPFERIIRREMTPAEIADRDPAIAAADLALAELQKLFNPPGIVRLVIFDDKKVPVFVLHHDAMPALAEGDTLQKYLESDANRKVARNFAWTSATATIADARRLLELRKVNDVFVTEHGRADEPTIGWVPDDNLAPPERR